jgi:hypothetical protein
MGNDLEDFFSSLDPKYSKYAVTLRAAGVKTLSEVPDSGTQLGVFWTACPQNPTIGCIPYFKPTRGAQRGAGSRWDCPKLAALLEVPHLRPAETAVLINSPAGLSRAFVRPRDRAVIHRPVPVLS